MLRIGLLGASRIAPTAVLAPAATRDDVTVTAVAARDPARARAFAETHGVAAVAAGYAELIARDDVDLVYNGLPPAGHAQWTIAALEAGKGVLCEKPFARDAAEARAMVEAAERAGRPLIEAFHYRFHNVIRRAEDLVRSGALGQIHRASAVFEVTIPRDSGDLRWSAEQGGGALMDLGCYPLHLMRTLLGEEPQIREARGEFVDGVDAWITAALAFPSGARADISCSMVPETRNARATIGGSKGRLEIVNFLAPQYGCRFTTTIGGETVEQPVGGPTTYEAQLAHVVDVMAGKTRPLTGGADAIANMAAIDRIYELAGRPLRAG
jgi:predicted dehydrogenase